ncbi:MULTISPECIES: aspartate aminotransferase family protein [Clostridium]|uniref:(S)-3-amino-2-methylpropionate transaminase n=2 Tax=Clostridium TaxID=1485 RepID=A0A1S9N5S7_CLOBE|nr:MULTISPECIES: aspartate aminotransferase family protein [Clostridium]EKQ54840.1 MAG: 4-aminobutyrate aminotransferase family protein [Clostridium sp. Maddingley MBC34-26]MZK51565.1 aminotransferase class III-fold pyridoxal phosphate-dependent enzyme [Clostridium beijerinckii]MZK59840.1 aminotransferase class III-fold pyridoxal phosphate-dependent enzyme [Clostridium beijerinckii]MZK70125.1 aminotransferase class III-fold pyridoxal phosphate-dependent enzyme [Clostridium beijerinckii]MZK7536
MLRDELPKIITGSVPGPKSKELLNRRNAAIPKALSGSTYPICIKRGEGAILEDLDGNKYIDWIGGVGVLNVGYTRPEIVEAVKEQSEKYFHTIFNVVVHEGYVELAEKFNEIMPCRGTKKKTFFANSGAEADENAIKVAKAYTKRQNVICFSGAFHGRTNLTMALTAKKAYSLGMGPFPSGIYRTEFPYLYRAPKGYTEEEAINYYIEKLKKIFDEATPASDVAAMLIEPIQGEGGFVPAPIEWVKAVRKICDENGILMIADEVQCGNCRTGKYFASEYWAEAGAAPDIVATAKSMGAGMPISAITAREEIMDSVVPGTIGGTFCGNPLACASALKTMEIMKKEDFSGKAAKIADKVMKTYMRFKEKYEVVGDVRGLGAMIGIEFVKNKKDKEPYPELVNNLVQAAIQKGLLIENAGSAGNVIRFLAPLCITDEQLDRGLEIFEETLKETLDKLS